MEGDSGYDMMIFEIRGPSQLTIYANFEERNGRLCCWVGVVY